MLRGRKSHQITSSRNCKWQNTGNWLGCRVAQRFHGHLLMFLLLRHQDATSTQRFLLGAQIHWAPLPASSLLPRLLEQQQHKHADISECLVNRVEFPTFAIYSSWSCLSSDMCRPMPLWKQISQGRPSSSPLVTSILAGPRIDREIQLCIGLFQDFTRVPPSDTKAL